MRFTIELMDVTQMYLCCLPTVSIAKPLGQDGDLVVTSTRRIVPSMAATSIFGELPQSVQYINLFNVSTPYNTRRSFELFYLCVHMRECMH